MMRRRSSAWLCALLIPLLAQQAPADAVEPDRRCTAGLFCIETVTRPTTLELWLETLTAQELTIAVEWVLLGGDTQRLQTRRESGAAERRRLFAVTRPAGAHPPHRWSFSFHPGHRPRRHDDRAVYRLPYGTGQAYAVIQGVDGSFSHRGKDRYAIDWGLPPGTLVRAARGGRVIGLYQEAEAGGTGVEDLGRDNFVWIEHDDGTVGWYAHFQADSLLVRRGQRVEAGVGLGRSGASGYASGPHLHFHVSTPSPGAAAYRSLPVRFDLGDEVTTPIEGRLYEAR